MTKQNQNCANQPEKPMYLAYASLAGVVHLCLVRSRKSELVQSLCRETILTKTLAVVAKRDLDDLATFNICRGCSARYVHLGYPSRQSVVRVPRSARINKAQLSLF